GDHPRRWIGYAAAFFLPVALGANAVYFSAFFLGVIMAEVFVAHRATPWLRHSAPALIVAGLIGAWFLTPTDKNMYLGVSSLLFVGLIFWRPTRWFLETGFSRLLGRISFPLYLVHALVMWTFTLRTLASFGALDGSGPDVRLLVDALTIVISFGLAC